jgi:hypothetical protein
MNEWNGAEPTVWSDDALLDAIGRGAVGRDITGVERVLIGWRSEANRRPVGELVSTDDAMAAIRAGTCGRDRMPLRYRVMFRLLRWFRHR